MRRNWPAASPQATSFSTLRCGSWIDAAGQVTGYGSPQRFSTLRCGSWIDAYLKPFLARGLNCVSVPFDAGRGLMQFYVRKTPGGDLRFSTLRCGSWIDAHRLRLIADPAIQVSVPFDAGRGLMRCFAANVRLAIAMFQYPSMRVVD